MNPHEPCKTRGNCYHTRNGRIGGYKTQATWGKTPEAHEAKVRGARKLNATWGKTLAARKARARNGRKTNSTWGKTPEAHEAEVCGARNQPREAKARGARKTNATWGKTPEAHEARVRGGRIGGRNGGRAAVESGQLACAAKGVPSTADGILFRSQTEASFYCVTQELGGEPRAHPPRIDLPDGRSYFPDFVLGRSVLDIPANIPIELKFARNAFYQKNLPKATEAGAFVVYWDELAEK